MGSELRAGHYHPVWLPNTMTWLYRQVIELEVYCNNYVYTEKSENEALFPFERLYSFEKEPYSKQLSDRFRKKLANSSGLGSMMSQMKFDKISLLHAHFGHIGIVGSKIADELGIPGVVTFYGMDLYQIPKRYPKLGDQYQEMFSRVSMILCEGEQMAESVIALGADQSKVVVHPLGIELEAIEHHPRSWNRNEPLKILIAASFRPKKGIPNAIRALSELNKSYKVEISIVGDAGLDQSSLIEKDCIFKAVTESGLQENTHFLGFKTHKELLEIAKQNHIFLQASQHADDGDCEGGVPVTLIEMAALGLQIVSTYHCDIPSVIKHGHTGWLAPEKDVDELVKVLHQAVDHSSAWVEMSMCSRDHIDKNYDAKKQAKVLFERYQEVVNG